MSVKLFDYYGISASDLFSMNNEYFNIDGIGNTGTYVSPSTGKIFTSRDQTYLLGRSQVSIYVLYLFIYQTYTIMYQLFQTYFIISNYMYTTGSLVPHDNCRTGYTRVLC